MYAARKGHMEVARYLVKGGADVNLKDGVQLMMMMIMIMMLMWM